MDLETILSSPCRRKIIQVLWEVGETNVMNVVFRTNSTYTRLNPHLKLLSAEGITIERYVGYLRLIKLNKENPRTVSLIEALKILKTPKS